MAIRQCFSMLLWHPRQQEDMGDIAQWFKAYEVSPRPLVAIARDKIIDLVGRSWTLTFGIESNCVVVNSDGGFLGIARIEVDDHQDDIAGGEIGRASCRERVRRWGGGRWEED